ncbi:methyl-accepting chemotaxis protein [Desulfosporosinus sp. Sb-LF]|nr:methyl-accepting chemotaxis protein [Desulfosporosinus sp. Sb-LF]
MNMQKKISGMTTTSVQIMGNKALAENIKYSIANTNATGAYYLQSKTQQEADVYLKNKNQAVTETTNLVNELRQKTEGSKGVAFLDAVLKDYSIYVNDTTQAYQAFQASTRVDTDGKTLVKDEQGVKKAQQLYYAATTEPAINNATSYLAWLQVTMEENQKQLSNLQTQNDTITTILTFIGLVLGSLIAFFISKNMLKSLTLLREATAKIAKGNLSEEMIVNSKDEYGEVAEDFNKMTLDLHRLVKEVVDTASTLGATGEELLAVAEEATSSSEQVSNTLGQLAAGATDQAVSVGDTSRIIEQLSINAQRVAANAENVSQSSAKAAQAAEVGALQSEHAVQKIEQIREGASQSALVISQLGDQSAQIGQIVDVIKGIADQTNLLALNAAIEAARAGEHGKGFAVVADEVRKLAEQSSSSATQIATLIGNIQRDTDRAVVGMEGAKAEVAAGVEAVTLAGQSFHTIVVEVNTVVEQIRQVTAAAQEMANGTVQAVKSIESIGVIAEQTAASTEEVSAASQEQAATMISVSHSADALARLGESLTNAVAKFKV